MWTRTRSSLAGMTALTFTLHALAAFSSPVATTGTIAGHVFERGTQAGLRFANVIVLETKLGTSVKGDGAFTIRMVPPGTYRLKANLVEYEPATSAPIEVVSGETTRVELSLVAVPITIYKWSPCGPASEYRPDAGPEVMQFAPEMRIRTMLGLRPPVDIERWDTCRDGGSIGSTLRDSCGSALHVSWDGAMRVRAVGDDVVDREPRRLYFGTPTSHFSARVIPVGSALETALLDVMRSWVDARIPRDSLDSLVHVAFDYSVPVETRQQRVGSSIERWRALSVAKLVRLLEDQRTVAAGNTGSRQQR